jgi:GntR family transcriptional regulator, rspAB operon transcriptional repressor
MSMSKSRASITVIEPNSRHEQAYAEIRRSILNGKMLPDEPLSEYQLAEQLKLSRTPVREALKRLEFEGLVRFVLNRGAFVAGLSVRDVVEIYQLREQLESFAAGVAATEMPAEDLNALERELAHAQKAAAKGAVQETFKSDMHLHKQLIQCTKNGRIVAILATLDDQVHRVRLLSPKAPGRLEATLQEHRNILDCIKRHDGQAAQQAMIQHLRAARENAIQLMMSSERAR